MSAITKIGILENDPNDIDLIQRALKKSGITYESKVAENEREFRELLKEFTPDIILSDYSLPSFDGLAAFKMVKEISPDTPFILVSGTVGDERAVDLIKTGITDYVLKDKLFTLAPKINRALRETKEKIEKKITDEKLHKANNLYAFISQVNHNIVRVKDEATLFRNSCNLAIKFGKFKMAWIGLFDFENQKISLVEQFGIDREDLKLFVNASYQTNGPQWHVLRNGTYFICNDIQTSLELKNWRPFGAERGINSCIVLPIKKSGAIIGTFNLYSTELDFSNNQEISLLEEVTEDISFALDIFEKEKRTIYQNDEKEKRAAELIIANRELITAELQKEFAQNNLKALINNTNDLMWSVDRNFNLITSNKPFEELGKLNFGIVIAVGENVLAAAHTPEMSQRFKSSYERAFRGEAFVEIEYFSFPSEIWSEISYYPIRKGDQIIGTACHSRDITIRKRDEGERVKMSADIIQHSKNLEQFASIVSHNLRAPVANILGLSNLLRNKISKEDKKRSQDYLFVATEQLDLVLRDLVKILQARSEINEYKEAVNLTELVDSIRSSIYNVMKKEKVQLVPCFTEINSVFTIKSYIYSIFYNLISNSIKYRQPEEAPLIEIKSAVVGEMIQISFKDNGVGIDLTQYGDKIFGLYKRFHPHIEGKGLGLFMVKTQVESLGGNIRVESSNGEGAKFTIELPK